MEKTRRELFDLIKGTGTTVPRMTTFNKTQLVETYNDIIKPAESPTATEVVGNITQLTEEKITKPEVIKHRESSDIEKVEVTQTPKNEMRENKKIVLDPDAQRDQELAKIVKDDSDEGKVVFVCGFPQTFVFGETEGKRETEQPDGSKITSTIAPKQLNFTNGIFETNDPVLIDLAINHPKFGKSFCYHKAYVPEDASPMIKERSLALSQTIKDSLKERQAAIERAREFSEEAHPEDGDFGIITDDNKDPNPISELE